MPVPLETVIRAACGDAQALAIIIRAHNYNRNAVVLLTALLLCDPDPHPLATLAALAMQERPPDALCAVARRAPSAAAALLEQDACADLRSALAPHLSRVWNALAAPSVPDDIAACARLATKMNAAVVAALLARIGAEGWELAPPAARAALLQALDAGSRAAARGGGAVWAALLPDERARVARSAAQRASNAADLLARIGAEGWALAPPEAQETLLQAMGTNPREAARGGGAVWAALEPVARARIAQYAAPQAFAAADLLDAIGAEGWRLAPPAARVTLLQAMESDPCAAAQGGAAVWTALEPDDCVRVARSAARSAAPAADLLDAIGAEGWKQTPPAARAALLQALDADPYAAARGGGKVWAALEPAERACIGRSAAGDSQSAADLLDAIGAEGWELAPPEVRAALLQAMETDPEAAARGGGKVWAGLDPQECVRIAQIAVQGGSAADLLARIGAEGWAPAPPAAQETLLQAMGANPREAALGGGAVWAALEPVARARIAQIAAQDASAAAVLLERIGAEGWRLAPPEARAALLQALDADPYAAARGGGKVWAALDDQARARIALSAAGDAQFAADLLDAIGAEGWELAPPAARETLLGAAARASHAAARALLILGDAPDDGARMRLLRAAAPGDDGSRAVAQALSEGAAWRDWMDAFVPDRNASGDTVARWRAVAHRLPAVVAARLPVSRPLRR